MKLLCKYLGGSYSYGLNTPTSDIDDRFLFIHTESSKIFGLERHDHQSKQNPESGEDSFGWELRHFLNLLRNGNTMCLEMLHNDKWLEVTDDFKYIQSYKNSLIDSHKLYKCLKGYCYSEKSLVLGERTGKLGGKRKETIDKYGYSYKNLVQFLRLCLCGESFFQTGVFPVNITQYDPSGLLYDIKTKPEKYSKDKAVEFMELYENRLNVSYNSIKVIFNYDIDVANDICYDLYLPILNSQSSVYFYT